MKLSFGTVIQDQPNYFIEKIWKGLTNLSVHMESDYYWYLQRHLEKFNRTWDGDQYTEFLEPKIHTIRKDAYDVWRPGMEIVMVTDKDGPEEFQFAPLLTCQHIQIVEMRKEENSAPQLRIDDQLFSAEALHQFAVNDGFQDAAALFSYFDDSFEGKLIHWTAFKY
ncbi:hypothetical protein H9X96_05290 [Pedobacter sp. N36a]|uniref:hypothetical protein n=1 Tax=Pedobacter sp. N36a TaxID=2767996 RepID=UPI001656DD10|nr:hypothetical protein [Pedobacter sp. N36a]MBC8985185.1 hypothetical protein [Pedobacter sp. N36a]